MAGRGWNLSGERGHIDDASVSTVHHRADESMSQLGNRRDHHLQKRRVPFPWRRQVASRYAVPRIVDEGIDGDTGA